MPTNGSEAIRVKPSDPRYFEIDLLQRMIMEAVQAQIAKNSALLGYKKTEPSELESETNPVCIPSLELAVHLEELKQKQLSLLEQDPNEYEPLPGIILLKAFLFPRLVEADEMKNETSARENELEPWEKDFELSPIGRFIEEELNLSRL